MSLQLPIAFAAQPEETPNHNRLQARFLDRNFALATIRCSTCKTVWPRDGDEILTRFEHRGFYQDGSGRLSKHPADVVLFWGHYPLRIELKTKVGDDYPAIKRQMDNSWSRLLLIDDYAGQVLTFEQLTEWFRQGGIRVLSLAAVEAELQRCP